ncbi:MAG: peptidase vanX D-ala-D-ala dipeptidase [Devosia sp.]|nr:peptidase vanX D-ala-D-ala dipeptidase [Devosia sp.]
MKIFCVLGLLLTAPAVAGELPPGFTAVAEVAPGVRQELRYATSHNFIGRPIAGYDTGACWLLGEVAAALAKVAAAAKAQGWRLIAYDCYRPERAVADFLTWSKDPAEQAMKAEFYPEIDKATLFKAGFIASRSQHSKGTTIDIGAELLGGTSLDFGTPFDSFFPQSATASLDISPEAQANRQGLVALMEAAGFENYSKEWWHFSLPVAGAVPYDMPIR